MNFCPQCGSPVEERPVDGVVRKACTGAGCGFVHWDNPTPVVMALVEVEGRYVLARNVQWPGGMFSVIAGFLERGEAPEDAVLREVEEELGVRGSEAIFLNHYSLFSRNQLLLAYLVRAAGTVRLNEELAEALLLSRDELLAYDFGPLHIPADIVRRSLEARPSGPAASTA